MIYTGLSRTGEIVDVKAHGGGDISEVYGGIGETNPIYYKSRTITGTLPLNYKALGKPLSDYLISGNTVQDGTPSPESPVDVVGCGVRTAQLFEDKISSCNIDPIGRLVVNPDFDMYIAKVEQGKTYIASAQITGGFFATKPVIGSTSYNRQRIAFASPTITAPITGYMTFRVNAGSAAPMLNLGSTALPYEPYGFKLPLTVNGVEHPIYLGQVETTRRIKKLVLTGEETWTYESDYTRFYTVFQNSLVVAVRLSPAFCSHYLVISDGRSITNVPNNSIYSDSGKGRWFIKTTDFTTVADFKSYLAAQYAAGTPVTVWYVLAKPETGIVNEPLHKIGSYTDTITMAQAGVTLPTTAGTNTLSVGTTVQPSEISIIGNIKSN